MICPKCGKEMFRGFIRSNNFYVPFILDDDKKLPENIKTKFNPLVAYGPFIPLSNYGGFLPPKARAYFCDNCNIVLIDRNQNLKNK